MAMQSMIRAMDMLKIHYADPSCSVSVTICNKFEFIEKTNIVLPLDVYDIIFNKKLQRLLTKYSVPSYFVIFFFSPYPLKK